MGRHQVEGSIVMGLGTALFEAIDFQNGRVLNAGFTRYRVPRSNDAPRIDTLLVGDPNVPSTGAGEPGIDEEVRLELHRAAARPMFSPAVRKA